MNKQFQFKQFTIYNTESSLKVGTDGVLLGAWADVAVEQSALDIGTGTGVIACMLAQRGASHVDAIDIQEAAYRNALYNVEQNPQFTNIQVHHCALQTFSSSHKYHSIVCNPPWFVNSMKSSDAAKNTARHDDQLPANQLFSSVARLLHRDGTFNLIIPAELERHYTLCANQSQLTVQKRVYIKTKPHKPAKRVMLQYSFNAVACKTEELSIEHAENLSYTDEYKNLTRDFYLKF